MFNESHIVNSFEKCQLKPKIVEFFVDNKFIIIDMACGENFMLALDDQGQVHSFGNNEFCQLGRELTVKNESMPKIIKDLPEIIIKVCCGWKHGMVLSKQGNVYIWGNPFSEYDKNFENIKNPLLIENIGKVFEIASGFHHFAALIQDNETEMFTWGANDYGQLGYPTNEEFTLKPQKVELSQFKGKPMHVHFILNRSIVDHIHLFLSYAIIRS